MVLDVNRSLKRFPPGIPLQQRLALQDQLTIIILRVISKYPHLSYYQVISLKKFNFVITRLVNIHLLISLWLFRKKKIIYRYNNQKSSNKFLDSLFIFVLGLSRCGRNISSRNGRRGRFSYYGNSKH